MTGEKVEHPQALAAASWWTNQISGAPAHDNGDDYASVLMVMVSAQQEAPKSGAYAMFSAVLRTRLNEHIDQLAEFDQWNGHDRGFTLSTDYGPEGILRDVVEEVGISGLHLPIKTIMWISRNEIRAKRGYGAQDQVVWSAPNG